MSNPHPKTVSNPHLKTELPGPNARAMLARDVQVASPSYPRDYPFVMSHGRGTEVWDVDGNRFLDFVAGIAVCATGHAHPKVVDRDQGGGRQVPAHLERLLAREHDAADRAAGRGGADG